MSIPFNLLPTTCDIYRPFGTASPTTSNVPCRLVADFNRSRQASDTPDWTHYLVLNPDIDIRDGCTRLVGSNGITYADGDEIRIPSGASSPRFVVVWVEKIETGSPREYKRAFLMRHTA